MNKNVFYLFAGLLTGSLLFSSCNKDDDDPEPITLTLSDSYTVDKCKVIEIEPAVAGTQSGTYLWTIGDSTISTQSKLEFISAKAGTYKVNLTVSEGSRNAAKEFSIEVKEAEYCSYATHLYDFAPTLGRTVNNMARKCTTKEDAMAMINQKIKSNIENNKASTIGLGCLGGTAIFAFDHTIMNAPEQNDFKVIISKSNEKGLGIVYVAYDRNKNGKPDDNEWCEIPGNLEGTNDIVTDYEVTFSHERVDDEINNESYYNWSDNKGKTGKYYSYTSFQKLKASEILFPTWINEDIICSGKMIVVDPNTINSKIGSNILAHYLLPNANTYVEFDISKAVDANGKLAQLPGADFIKVKSAVFCEKGYYLNGYFDLVLSQVEDLHLVTTK